MANLSTFTPTLEHQPSLIHDQSIEQHASNNMTSTQDGDKPLTGNHFEQDEGPDEYDEAGEDDEEQDYDYEDDDPLDPDMPAQGPASGSSQSKQSSTRIKDHLTSLSHHASKLHLDDHHNDTHPASVNISTSTHNDSKDRSDRATSEQVLDPRTRMILLQLINRGIVSEINGVISTGKEANVYHAIHTPPPPSSTSSSEQVKDENRAIKVYKTSILVFKDRDRYVSGEFRFRRGYNKSNNRQMVKVWAEKEYRNLKRIYDAGQIPCPKPMALRRHVLVMDFVGSKKGWAAPRLRDVVFSDKDEEAQSLEWKRLYVQLLGYMRRLYQVCKLVHADLSEYNLLFHDEKIWMIDVSQSVEHDHPRSLEFLRMDIKNVTDFFHRQKGVDTFSERTVFEFITTDQNKIGVDETAMKMEIEKLYVARKEKGVSEEDDKISDEVFRQQYIPRNLNEVYDTERDAEQIHRGEGDELVYRALLANKVISPPSNHDENKDEQDKSHEDHSGQDESDEDEDDESWSEDKPRGKRFQDKDEKKEHKKAVKEEKREKRANKMPKHVKKKLVNESSKHKK